MKKIVLLTAFIFCHLLSASAQSKANFAIVQQIQKKNTASIDVFIKGDVERIKELLESNRGMFKRSAGNIVIAKLTFLQIAELLKSEGVERIEAYPQHTIPMNDTALINNNIIAIHNGAPPLARSYDGSGVIMGIMDTGLDFTHPDFIDSLGKTRVKFYWDQNRPASSNTPVGYDYGQEWDNVQIDSGKAVPATDSHGTHVAGVAAANGNAIKKYKGVAPNADLIIVSINFNSLNATIIADAVDYIYTKATLLGKPCVINASIGDYLGSHDGKDLQAQFINNLIIQKSGRVFVASAGNKGDSRIHLGYTVTADTNFTFFSPENGSVFIEIWGDTTDLKNTHFAVEADQLSPVYSQRGRSKFSTIRQTLGIYGMDTIFNKNGKRLGTIETFGDLTGSTYSMIYYIVPDSISYKWRLMATGNGKFDLWNLSMMSTGIPSSKVMHDSIFYKYPDLQQTMVSSYQCLDNVITVGNYTNRKSYIDYNHKLYYAKEIPGKRHPTSSCGPTRDGRLKPDIVSPGDMTLASLVQTLRPVYIANNPSALAPEGYHSRDGGTSTAGPGVAGIAALYLQKNPNASAMEVKNAILRCARQDAFTGNTPNNMYGYGKADGFKTLTECDPNGIETYENNPVSFYIHPNPVDASSAITLEVSLPPGAKIEQLIIYNELGTCMLQVSAPQTQIQLTPGFSPGIYFCKLITNTQIVTTKKLIIL